MYCYNAESDGYLCYDSLADKDRGQGLHLLHDGLDAFSCFNLRSQVHLPLDASLSLFALRLKLQFQCMFRIVSEDVGDGSNCTWGTNYR